MLAFLDTEFTDLVTWPRLLSLGIVTDASPGRSFYAEVTDPDRLQACGRYGRYAVLPQFGQVPHAACSHAELGGRLSAFLDDLLAGLRPDEYLELAHGYHLDWDLLDLAIREAGARSWAQTKRRIHPVNVYEQTGFGAGQLAADAYFKTQAHAPYGRHHALCDARALRLAYRAAVHPQRPAATADVSASLPAG
jgi:hypothetical protein